MTAQEVRTYIGYSGWASRKVLECALALPPEDRTKPMSVSHECIANTLAHIYFGDAIWFSRIAGPNYPVPPHDALPSLDFVSRRMASPAGQVGSLAMRSLTQTSPVRFPSNHALSATPAYLRGKSWCT